MKKAKRNKKNTVTAKIRDEEKGIEDIAHPVSPLLEKAVETALEDTGSPDSKKSRPST